MSELRGKSALVTGAGRGIGRAISLTLARAGVRVALASRTRAELESAAREVENLGSKALVVPCDVADEAAVKNAVQRTQEIFGTIDILVNNAGIGTFARVVEMATDDFDRMFATNMRGVFLCTRVVLPMMIGQRSGDIINISSLAGRNAFVGGAGYAATKWALIGFARCLMLEVREHNIRVITVCPGSVATDFDRRSDSRSKDPALLPSAEDIARVVANALAMPRNVMVSEIDVRPTNPQWK